MVALVFLYLKSQLFKCLENILEIWHSPATAVVNQRKLYFAFGKSTQKAYFLLKISAFYLFWFLRYSSLKTHASEKCLRVPETAEIQQPAE